MTRLAKGIGIIVTGLLAVAVIYGGLALILGRLPVNAGFRPDPAGIEIAVVDNGIHTDLILPVKTAAVDWRGVFPPAAFPRPVAVGAGAYVLIGWGHRDFYLNTPQWSDLTAGTAIRAVLGIGGTVFHVQYLDRRWRGGNVVWLRVSPAGYEKLAAQVAAKVRRGPTGAGRAIRGAGYGDGDAFFEARGGYGPVSTCNQWTRDVLVGAGVRSGLWTPFSFQILDHLRALPP